MAKTIRETICNNGGFNCKAVLDLELSHVSDGLPIYIYKCKQCGLEERGAQANQEKPKPKRPLWPTNERID